MGISFDDLASTDVWVAWREEIGTNSKGEEIVRKVPYSLKSGKMAAGPHAGWGSTRAEAERLADRIKGDVGVVLGVPLPGRNDRLGGIDLDRCRDPETGKIEPWAEEIIQEFRTYGEGSPSRTGVKLFFLYEGNPDKIKAVKRPDGKAHPPGIEPYFEGRYFAVTENALDKTKINLLDDREFKWLANDAIPRFVGATRTERPKEKGRSEQAFAMARDYFRAAKGLSKFREDILGGEVNPEATAHILDQKDQERAILRCWGRAGQDEVDRWFGDLTLPSNSKGERQRERNRESDNDEAGDDAEDDEDMKEFVAQVKLAVAASNHTNDFILAPGTFDPDEEKPPPRPWLYGKSFMRTVASGTIAPGGTGKSALTMTENIAMATGVPLLEGKLHGGRPLKVWYHNQEDSLAEMKRRAHAVCDYYRAEKWGDKQLDDDARALMKQNLHMTGSDSPKLIFATMKNGEFKINMPTVKEVYRFIRDNNVDFANFDPYVSLHRINENDPGMVEALLSIFRTIAERTNCAIHIVHHTRKKAQGQSENTVEDARGSSAFIAAVRILRVMVQMTKKMAGEHGITVPGAYFRLDHGKANLTPPEADGDWFHMASVLLGNARDGFEEDNVQAVEVWVKPKVGDGLSIVDINRALDAIDKRTPAGTMWRENSQAADWVGNCIADALGLDRTAAKGQVQELIRKWKSDGFLVDKTELDAKRMPKLYVVTAKRATDAAAERFDDLDAEDDEDVDESQSLI